MTGERILSHRDLIVWQKAMDLVIAAYAFTDTLPQKEIYGLSSQMRRCVVSVSSNIAEGKQRGTRKDFRQFLIMAYGSGAELNTQLEICKRLGFGGTTKRLAAEKLLDEVMRMLNVFITKLAALPLTPKT